MKPYYKDGWVTIYHGDSREIMPQVPAVDMVLTDPPYAIQFMGDSYGELAEGPVEKSWKSRGLTMTSNPSTTPSLYKKINPRCGTCGRTVNGRNTEKGYKVCECGANNLVVWPNSSMVRLHHWHMLWEIACFDILKQGGHIVAFASTRTFGRLACSLEDSGFEIRDMIVWQHGDGVWRNNQTLRTVYEPAVVARKPCRISGMGNNIDTNKRQENIIRVKKPSPAGRLDHPTQKPIGLFQELLSIYGTPGGIILDPFFGSGTTGIACKLQNQICIGIEKKEKYCEIAANRCRQMVMELKI